MAIISKIGRKAPKVKLLFFAMYSALCIGALTMLYPFMIMVSGSAKDSVDLNNMSIIPRFWHNDTWLYRKHIADVFNEKLSEMNIAYDLNATSFKTLAMPEKVNNKQLAAFLAFLKENPLNNYSVTAGRLMATQSRLVPDGTRDFKKYIIKKYGDDILQINKQLDTNFKSWNTFVVAPMKCLLRRQQPGVLKISKELYDFQRKLPLGLKYYASIEGLFVRSFLKSKYSSDIDKYNSIHDTNYSSYGELVFPDRIDTVKNKKQRQDWEVFVCKVLAVQWIRADKAALTDYRAFLKAKYENISSFNNLYKSSYASFNTVDFPVEPLTPGIRIKDWADFIGGWHNQKDGKTYKIKTEYLRIVDPRTKYLKFLQKKYATLANINKQLATNYLNLNQIQMPQQQVHLEYFKAHKNNIRWRLSIRNYLTVFEYMIIRGRAAYNTVIYCFFAVLTALIINPLAAYAMSRYNMPSTYKILLFLMCTMAFPPMVTAIPNFLMLRNLGLLNTFVALILPNVANGYSIFLLKGFFDSLPRELYESASLDGAGEIRMFWMITMNLSKPILAVIGLAAFNAAYSNFMLAFIICQDEQMWTLMVWLYQLQQNSGQGVQYAALLLAAIPTFLVFLFCQNIIMRGIVIPTEK